MLKVPVIVQVRVVMWDTSLVGGIIKAIRRVDQCRGSCSYDLISVRDAGRDQYLPGTKLAHIKRIAVPESRRFRAEVYQHHLKHPGSRSPAIGLKTVEVKRFDDARVVNSG